MADRTLFIGWSRPARGKEERALEVFDEAMGILGRMQQEGRVAGFDVQLLRPNEALNGCITVRGTAEQIAALREDADFRRNTVEASTCVDGLTHIEGFCDAGVAEQMTMYREAIAKLPQHA